MDELCKLLADKLGIVADSSISWLQAAIPQYAEMMAIKTTFEAALATIGFALSFAILAFLWKKVNESDGAAVASIGAIFAAIAFLVAALLFLPEAICWHVTPDAMLLRELVGTVA